MTCYQQLSLVERAKIITLKLQGLSHREIAKQIKRSHTTIGRELQRNHQGHEQMSGYVPELADKLYRERNASASSRLRLKNDAIRNYVIAKLHLRWTPEQISAVISSDIENANISHEAIYQFIYTDYREGIPLLARSRKQRYPRQHSKKRRAPKIKNRTDIDKRPEVINTRDEFGHWESDSIVSRSGKSAINVILERQSRRIFINKVADKTAQTTMQAIVASLLPLPKHARKSLTYDNGAENYYHEKINKRLNTDSYFCKPYHSWEKGAVENANELIRRYIPKKTNLDTVTAETLKNIEYEINNRPKKCLGFKTPADIFNNKCGVV